MYIIQKYRFTKTDQFLGGRVDALLKQVPAKTLLSNFGAMINP